MSASATISPARNFPPMFQTGPSYTRPAPSDRPKGIKNRFVQTGDSEEKAHEPTRNELPAISETGGYAEELSRTQQLNFYLGNVRDAGDISQSTATLALRAWASISELLAQNLPVPDAAPGPEGQLLFVWNKGEHHLELEIFPDSPSEFFYFNRVTNESWEDEYNANTPVSQQAKDKLSIFTSTK